MSLKKTLRYLFYFEWLKSHFFLGCVLIATACYGYLMAQQENSQAFGYIEPIQNWAFDLYQRKEPRVTDEQSLPVRAVIIDVDEASLDAYGQFPWPRTVMAQLVENLHAHYNVLVTGFDIVFAEPDRTSPSQFIKQATDLDDKVKTTLEALPDNDDVFAQAIAKSNVVLGQVGELKPIAEGRLHPKLHFSEKKASFEAPSLKDLLRTYNGAVLNIETLEGAADGIGLFSTVPDGDGVYRKVFMLEQIREASGNSEVFPALSLEMIRIALGSADNPFVEIGDDGIKQIFIKAASGEIFKIPTDPKGRVWVHFAKYPTAKPPLYVSAKDVLDKTAPKELLANRLAIVGTSAIGLKDIRPTPINPILPGVEVHAQVMETILAGSHLKRWVPDLWKVPGLENYLSGGTQELELLTIIIGGLLIIFLIPRLSAWLTFVTGAGIILGLYQLGWFYYREEHVLLDWAYPAMCLFVIFFTLTYLNYAREEKQRKQIRHAFGHYVSPALLEQLADDPEKLVLGGETRHITVLFSDIRGFTTISERFNAQELTRFINRFLTPMTNVIMTSQGTVDKYMGDAIMAFWNAPLNDPQHPINACKAALQMQKEVKELNDFLKEEAARVNEGLAENDENRRHHVPIAIGVGINSGMCCVGNMGSEQRFDYSALGDDVNLASRLEGQSKTYGVDIVLGENTVNEIKDKMAYIELDLIQVKGKTQPVKVFALLGDETMLKDETYLKVHECVDAMLKAYRAQKWDESDKKANELSKLHKPLVDLARLYINRAREYRDNPPPAGWDGTYIATTK